MYFIKSKPLFFSSAACLVLLISNVWAQSNPLDQLTSSFNNYSKKAIQEKVFMHVDRDLYLSGEIMWFKINVVNGANHKPIDLSKLAYIEIIDTLQHAVLQTKVSLQNGKGDGSFIIPSTIGSGNFKVRAYTNWMKNNSPDFYFEQNIKIINPLRQGNLTLQKTSSKVDFQFFPEGGNLVANLENKLAFKVVDFQSKGLDFRGCLIDQNSNDTIVKFQPVKYGMGEFSFTPLAGKTYKAVVFIGTKKYVRDIPRIFSEGLVMKVSDFDPAKLQVKVSKSGRDDIKSITLLTHTRQNLKTAEIGNFSNNEVTFYVDKTKLDEGISHLTIFTSEKEPVCERLYFKRPESPLLLAANLSKANFKQRNPVEIDLKSTIGNVGRSANLSMAVYRLDSLSVSNNQNVQTYLWLTSDLRGYIEDPDYYLNSSETAVKKATDNLMLTQGWRRFNWREVFNNTKVFEYLPEFEGQIITGKIADKATGGDADGVITYLSMPGKKADIYSSRSDKEGRFSFFTRNFYGSNELFLQNNINADSTYQIDVFSPFSTKFSDGNSDFKNFQINSQYKIQLTQRNINNQLNHFYISKKQKQFYPPSVDTTSFFGREDVKYNLDDYTRFTTMEEVFKEYVPEVTLSKKQKKLHLKINYTYKNGVYDNDALLLIDGVPFFDADKIMAFDPLKLKTIQIVNRKYLLGEKVEDGIINFQTYKNDLASFELDSKAFVIDYEGLQLQRHFYSPAYDTDKQLLNRIPDFRELLFWAPEIQTDNEGAAKVKFFTSDQIGKYQIVIQGLDNSGSGGSTIKTLNVVK